MTSRRIAFLLAQLGAEASAAFEQAVAPLGITASEAGLLRLVGRSPGIGQKAASDHLKVRPSRVVALLDRLEHRGYIERRRSTTDRRSHEVHLTTEGELTLAALRPLAEAHEAAFTKELTETELSRLAAYLATIAASRGLSRDVHRDTHDNAEPTTATATTNQANQSP